jgi:hypothetical protein
MLRRAERHAAPRETLGRTRRSGLAVRCGVRAAHAAGGRRERRGAAGGLRSTVRCLPPATAPLRLWQPQQHSDG